MAPPVAYLDHASTSPLRPEALDAMSPWLGERFGNPSGSHSLAREALRALDDARERVAAALGCEPAEVVFTSGGTEADNLAVIGAIGGLPGGAMGTSSRPPATDAETPAAATLQAACSAVEHPAVLELVRALGGLILPVDADGVIDLDLLRSRLSGASAASAGSAASKAAVAIVSVMAVNNETGVVQPTAAVADAVRDTAPGALFHTDAVQAVGILDMAELTAAVDLLSISGHKFGGPPGAGALVVRAVARARLSPILRGGPQERELRAGTQNLPAIAGMVAALEAAVAARPETHRRLALLGDQLEDGLCSVDGVVGAVRANTERSPAIRNVRVAGVEAEELLIALDQLGVCASAGSACASGALDPSHVLMAMGRASSSARQHVRFSLGWSTTPAEIPAALEAFGQAVARLRA